MKRTSHTIAFAAAAMLAAVATGSAQTLKAEIPFPFHSKGARRQPGSYTVHMRNAGGTRLIQIYNADQHRSIMTLVLSADQPSEPRAAQPALTFACTESNCQLASLRDANAAVCKLVVSKAGPATRVATVMLHPDRGE